MSAAFSDMRLFDLTGPRQATNALDGCSGYSAILVWDGKRTYLRADRTRQVSSLHRGAIGASQPSRRSKPEAWEAQASPHGKCRARRKGRPSQSW
jgi:hypothetical protein